MNVLIAKIQWQILSLPILDPMKNYYNNFLETVKMSTLSDEKKLEQLKILMEAIRARFSEHWYNSPLVFLFDTVVSTLEDIGKGALTIGKAGLDLAKPVNLIIILSVIAVIIIFIFLIIARVKS